MLQWSMYLPQDTGCTKWKEKKLEVMKVVALLNWKATVADKAAPCTVYRHTQTFCGLEQTLKASGFVLF